MRAAAPTAPKVSGPGVRYQLTEAGDELRPVLLALGAWGERWVELRDKHTNPRTLAKWHTRQLEWADAQRPGQIRVTGPRALARMLPT
jgi:hypothetical protein